MNLKRDVLILLLTMLTSNICFSQEWMTSLEAAKRTALVQDKFLFMMWEEAASIPYPVIMNDTNGNEILFDDLFQNEEINRIIWKYFVPVKVDENLYGELYDEIKDTKSRSYMLQFEDDNIKIMDPNLNIVNTSFSPEAYFNLSQFITNYGLNTSYLNAELRNYAEHKNFGTAYRLASKYMDFAILVNRKTRQDIVSLSLRYLDDAERYLITDDINGKKHFADKISLLRWSQYLLQNRPKKVLRLLKRFDTSEIDETTASQLAFLYYTAYELRKDEKNAGLWKGKVSLVNLRKAELIANLHL
ncbi:hypothetical protein [Gelidibacter maritimus]|uniref:Uncharacterized protein n=1 Tax=Gelidibacter maritimus TaxID=2761487 RepID=A0A7W2M4V3_9FLAO|nr:hypothetical protein [Gelidibacter maritimus]MBA6152752.1 hypothetical protein [Gelidibacter maritimus]